MTNPIPLAEFAQLVYGGRAPLTDDVVQNIRGVLGKNRVESISDVRVVTMALDQQAHPTPMTVRFSTEDVSFCRVNGIECAVDASDISVSRPGALSGQYEPHIAATVRGLVKEGWVAYDIGANVGFHSMLMSRLVGANGRVFAFEPNSENCRLILLAAEHNGAANVTLLPIALSDTRGWAYFSCHIGSNGGFVSEQFVTSRGHGTVIPTFTLDELSLPAPDLIKIDVEGAEYKALKGAERTLVKCRPAIICEFSVEMTRRVSEVEPMDFLSWIAGLGYRIFVIDRTSHSPVPQRSVSELLGNWGHWSRIEDLLLMPEERQLPPLEA